MKRTANEKKKLHNLYKMFVEEIENGSGDCKSQTMEVGVRERQFTMESIERQVAYIIVLLGT